MRLIKPLEYNRKIGSEFLSIDIGSKSMKVVRCKKVRSGLIILDVDLREYEESGLDIKSMTSPLPPGFKSAQCTLTLSESSMAVRLLSIPEKAFTQGSVAKRISDQMGLGVEYRYSYQVLKSATSRQDAEVLVAALTETATLNALETFSKGTPAPIFLETSHLSALKAYSASEESKCDNSAVAFVEAGAESVFLSVFANNQLSLVRSFPVGAERLFADIERRFGLGTTQARAVMSVNNFDVSESVTGVLGLFIDQLNLSKDYIERRDGVRLQNVYISGGLGLSPYVLEAVSNAVNTSVHSFNPFNVNSITMDKALKVKLQGQEVRYSAAIGAALNAVEAV